MTKQTSSILLRLGINRGWLFKLFSNPTFYTITLNYCLFIYLFLKMKFLKNKIWLMSYFIFFNYAKCVIHAFYWQALRIEKKKELFFDKKCFKNSKFFGVQKKIYKFFYLLNFSKTNSKFYLFKKIINIFFLKRSKLSLIKLFFNFCKVNNFFCKKKLRKNIFILSRILSKKFKKKNKINSLVFKKKLNGLTRFSKNLYKKYFVITKKNKIKYSFLKLAKTFSNFLQFLLKNNKLTIKFFQKICKYTYFLNKLNFNLFFYFLLQQNKINKFSNFLFFSIKKNKIKKKLFLNLPKKNNFFILPKINKNFNFLKSNFLNLYVNLFMSRKRLNNLYIQKFFKFKYKVLKSIKNNFFSVKQQKFFFIFKQKLFFLFNFLTGVQYNNIFLKKNKNIFKKIGNLRLFFSNIAYFKKKKNYFKKKLNQNNLILLKEKFLSFHVEKLLNSILGNQILVNLNIYNIKNFIGKSFKRTQYEKKLIFSIKTSISKKMLNILKKGLFSIKLMVNLTGWTFKLIGLSKILVYYIALKLKLIKSHWTLFKVLEMILVNYQQMYSFAISGFKVYVKGKINNSLRTRKYIVNSGRLNQQSFNSLIDFAQAESFSLSGIFTIRFWLQIK